MKVKYFLRGLGIGILVTTLLLFIGGRKNNPGPLTDSEIMKQARKLGMMTEAEFKDNKMDENLDNLKESLTGTEVPNPTVTVSPKPSPQATVEKEESSKSPVTSKSPDKKKEETKKPKTISIEIEPGMVSQSIAKYLYQKNVIGSASDFNEYMLENDVTQKLRAGTFEIPTDASYAEIVKIIT